MTHSPRSGRLRRSSLAAFPLLLGLSAALPIGPARAQQALFGALDVEQQRFVLVAAPIGSSGSRYQLNIYEQINDRRPCFATGSTLPAPVNPLLATFDFTGICGRYIDANGYSLRVGGTDLATSYRLIVRSEATGTVLVALPTKAGAGPEMIVARSGGPIGGFHKLEPEPGWRLMRRTYAGRRLGHLYVYSDGWPLAATGGGAPAAAGPDRAPATSAPTGTAAGPPAPASTSRPSPAAAGGPAPASPEASAGQGAAGRPATVGTPLTGEGLQPSSTPLTTAPAASPLSGAPSAPPPPPPRL